MLVDRVAVGLSQSYISSYSTHTGSKCLAQVEPLLKWNVPEKESGRVATPISISIFDSSAMKSLSMSSLASKCQDFKLKSL